MAHLVQALKGELGIDLSFLGDGAWQLEIFEDGVNADRTASDYRRIERTVQAGDTIRASLAPGGGWVARFNRLP